MPDDGKFKLWLEWLDFRHNRAIMSPHRIYFRSENADVRLESFFGPDKADLRPEWADFEPERAKFGSERTD